MEETQQTSSPASTEAKTSNTPRRNGLYALIALVLILLVGVGSYALLHHSNTQRPVIAQQMPPSVSPTSTISSQPTPVISPVTAANVNQTLSNTDTTMQQSINQANTDLNSINNIDKTQDSTSGL